MDITTSHKININKQYYSFALHEKSQHLCTIVTPFSKYKYLHLPMDIKQLPDIAQEILESLFPHIMTEHVEVYINR